MKSFSHQRVSIDLRKYIFAVVVWTLLISASLTWNIYQVHGNTLFTATAAARANIEKDVIIRKWATLHGGVYVPPTDSAPPNPYLKIPDRDVVTTTGKRLTLMNPAYVLRDMQTQFGEEYNSHLTSLNPINPNNAADDWETKAMREFEVGSPELLEVQQIGSKPYLRLMLPIFVEQGCLKCHAHQGYKLGDVRGGISSSISLQSYFSQEQKRKSELAFSHGLLWLMGLVTQYFSYRHTCRLNTKRRIIEDELKLNERRASSLLDLTLRANQLTEAELLTETLNQAEKLTRSEIAYVHFVNDDQETITLGTWSTQTLQTCDAIYEAHYPISQAGIWADCFRQKKSCIYNNYPVLTTKKGLPEGHTVLQRIMNVPVIEAGEVRMIIGVGNKETDYDEGDLRELELVAASLWSLIKRKRVEIELTSYQQHLEELVSTRTTQLVAAKEAAEAANVAKSIFISTMSHELRTPLNAILGFSELMGRDCAVTQNQKETLGIINRSGAHLLSMINDVLDLSKIEAGRFELDIRPCDLSKLLQDVGEMINVRAGNKQLAFKLELSPTTAQFIYADSGKLRQVLINLLGNAIKFTRQGTVILYATLDASLLKIDVVDTGMGIPAEKIDELFKPFVQLIQDNADMKGTGLGLAISKSLIELMGGKIRVTSELGVGSTFKIELPVLLANSTDMRVEKEWQPVKSLAPNQTAWRLLVVDDNADNRLLLTTVLRNVGFDVNEAENGQEAIHVFEHWRPHLIWLDMRMPVMDGYEAAARIRQLEGGEQVKIIALTASVFSEQHARIMQSGCEAVLHKPFHAPEIFAALTQHLGVEFIYESTSSSVITTPIKKTTAKMLTILPVDLRQQLHDAAVKLDTEEIDEALEQTRVVSPEVADGLEELAKNYQFDQIIQLIEAAAYE